MTYLEIPQAARETGANAIKGTWTLFETCPELAQEVTDLVLSAALPHLLAEVKVLTETATKVAYALGRKDAGEEIAVACEKERETYAEGIDADGGRSYALAGTSIGLTKAAEIARDLPLLASGATSDATSGVPGHLEVSEAVRSPQEPCGHPTCPCASQEDMNG